MTKKSILFRQEHYVAPAVETLVTNVTVTICAVSPTFGEENHAGADVDVEQTYDL